MVSHTLVEGKDVVCCQNYQPPSDSMVRRSSTDFLNYIHSFRAIAILIIVGVHCLDFLTWTEEKQTTRNFLDDIFANGSLVFVFIAGFLFQHLSPKFAYVAYLKKKISNVILPYALLSIPAIYYSGFYHKPTTGEQSASFILKMRIIARYYLVGGAHVNYPYWFIPMIALFYLAAPVFMQFIKHPKLYFLLGILIPISILVHRPPWPHLNPVHNAIYFCSAYMLGMVCSQFKERVFNFINSHLPLFIGLYILSFSMYYIFAEHGLHTAMSMFSHEHGYIDFPYIEKAIFSFVLLVLLQKYSHFLPSIFKYIADISFSIYFFHIYVLICISHFIRGSLLGYGNWFSWCVLFVLTIVSSCCITWFNKKILGKKSRFVIGS